MFLDCYGLGIEDPACDDFESAQDICNRWEDNPVDLDYDIVILNLERNATHEK